MGAAIFTLDDVRYRQVLHIEQLHIQQHEITCLVGSSGSGKSTLLRLLNRMISPDSGRITYRSEPIDAMDAVALRRKVVMLPQNPIMFEGSLRDNLLKGIEFGEREPVSDERLQSLLELMQVDKNLNAGTGKLSGGERQRVSIARVLAMQPDVLLLDEPSSALDVTTQNVVISNLIADARAANTTIVMVTHANAIAEQWADHLIEIRAGQVASSTRGSTHG